MAYCTKADLIARGWEDEINSLTNNNDARLNQAISDTSAEIDSYLIGQMTLPLTNPSDFLVRKACDMVRFYLYDIGVIEPVANRYTAAIEFLRGIDTGKTPLTALIDGDVITDTSALIAKPVLTAPVKVFSDDLLSKM